MNIYILDKQPYQNARSYIDGHIESALVSVLNVLTLAHHLIDGPKLAQERLEAAWYPMNSHADHPWAVWARASDRNYTFVHDVGRALLVEYALRFGRVYGPTPTWEGLRLLPRRIKTDTLLPFPQVMPEQYRRPLDAIEAYRDYYFGEKQSVAVWSSPAQTPGWWKDRLRVRSINEDNRRAV
jgi:hypothetical protein